MRERESFNLVDRLFRRQVFGSPPGSAVVKQRQLYENIVPNDQAKQVEPPDCYICKFLPSGSLVCFGNMQHDIIIYNYIGNNACSSPGTEDIITFPDGLAFKRFFQLKYRQMLAHGHELLCKELCLAALQERFLIVASCTAPTHAPQQQPDHSPIQGVPLVASTTIHVIEAETGRLCGQYTILDDFVHLSHANGVFLLDNVLCVLAVRSQTVHILHITESGGFVVGQKLGMHCREDDELALARYNEAIAMWENNHSEDASTADRRLSGNAAGPGPSSAALIPSSQPVTADAQPQSRTSLRMQRAASTPLPREPEWSEVLVPPPAQRQRLQPQMRGTPRSRAHAGEVQAASPSRAQQTGGRGFIQGVRQRLMAYLYRRSCSKHADAEERRQFFYHFEDYANLAMWKVQLLDREHLLMSMGPPDAGVAREGGVSAQSYCLILWSIPEALVVDLHDVGSTALLQCYQRNWQDFHAGCILSPWHRFLSPSAGCRTQISIATPTAVVRRMLSNLPASSQVMSPSPYLDVRLFNYDEKLISAMIRPRPFTETPLKFAVRSRTEKLRFKLQPAGGEVSLPNGRPIRQLVAYHFHPWLPVVLCVVQSFVAPPQLTIFLRNT